MIDKLISYMRNWLSQQKKAKEQKKKETAHQELVAYWERMAFYELPSLEESNYVMRNAPSTSMSSTTSEVNDFLNCTTAQSPLVRKKMRKSYESHTVIHKVVKWGFTAIEDEIFNILRDIATEQGHRNPEPLDPLVPSSRTRKAYVQWKENAEVARHRLIGRVAYNLWESTKCEDSDKNWLDASKIVDNLFLMWSFTYEVEKDILHADQRVRPVVPEIQTETFFAV